MVVEVDVEAAQRHIEDDAHLVLTELLPIDEGRVTVHLYAEALVYLLKMVEVEVVELVMDEPLQVLDELDALDNEIIEVLECVQLDEVEVELEVYDLLE